MGTSLISSLLEDANWMGMMLPDMAQASVTAATAFGASNLDDIMLLLLLFSRADTRLERWHVVAGQYLGFALLVLASLLGFVSGQLLPHDWIGLLGLVPIWLGMFQVIDNLNGWPDSSDPSLPAAHAGLAQHPTTWLHRLGLPWSQIVAVAALTIANGGDNLGLYVPLFAQANSLQLSTILVVFLLLIGLWCLAAWSLVRAPAVADLIQRYGQPLVPVALISLGLLILAHSQTFANRPLAVVVLAVLMAMAWSVLRQLQSTSTASCGTTPSVEISSPIA